MLTRHDAPGGGPSSTDGPPASIGAQAPDRFEPSPRFGGLWLFALALLVVSIATDLAVWRALPELTRSSFLVLALVRYALPVAVVLLATVFARAIRAQIGSRYTARGQDQTPS